MDRPSQSTDPASSSEPKKPQGLLNWARNNFDKITHMRQQAEQGKAIRDAIENPPDAAKLIKPLAPRPSEPSSELSPLPPSPSLIQNITMRPPRDVEVPDTDATSVEATEIPSDAPEAVQAEQVQEPLTTVAAEATPDTSVEDPIESVEVDGTKAEFVRELNTFFGQERTSYLYLDNGVMNPQGMQALLEALKTEKKTQAFYYKNPVKTVSLGYALSKGNTLPPTNEIVNTIRFPVKQPWNVIFTPESIELKISDSAKDILLKDTSTATVEKMYGLQSMLIRGQEITFSPILGEDATMPTTVHAELPDSLDETQKVTVTSNATSEEQPVPTAEKPDNEVESNVTKTELIALLNTLFGEQKSSYPYLESGILTEQGMKTLLETMRLEIAKNPGNYKDKIITEMFFWSSAKNPIPGIHAFLRTDTVSTPPVHEMLITPDSVKFFFDSKDIIDARLSDSGNEEILEKLSSIGIGGQIEFTLTDKKTGKALNVLKPNNTQIEFPENIHMVIQAITEKGAREKEKEREALIASLRVTEETPENVSQLFTTLTQESSSFTALRSQMELQKVDEVLKVEGITLKEIRGGTLGMVYRVMDKQGKETDWVVKIPQDADAIRQLEDEYALVHLTQSQLISEGNRDLADALPAMLPTPQLSSSEYQFQTDTGTTTAKLALFMPFYKEIPYKEHKTPEEVRPLVEGFVRTWKAWMRLGEINQASVTDRKSKDLMYDQNGKMVVIDWGMLQERNVGFITAEKSVALHLLYEVATGQGVILYNANPDAVGKAYSDIISALRGTEDTVIPQEAERVALLTEEVGNMFKLDILLRFKDKLRTSTLPGVSELIISNAIYLDSSETNIAKLRDVSVEQLLQAAS